VKYITGAKNIIADRLSRQADHESQLELLVIRVTPEVEQTKEIIVKENKIISRNSEVIDGGYMLPVDKEKVRRLSDDWIRQIKEGYENDQWFSPIFEILKGLNQQEDSQWSKAKLQKANIQARRF
jgi:hypothetical protein